MTLIWIGLVYLIVKEGQLNAGTGMGDIKKLLLKSFRNPGHSGSALILAAFALFLFLPLFWGLTFYLQSDINVLIVIGFMVWVYKWFKFLFLTEA